MNNIGEKIRSIRNIKGYSQENMAQMLDISLPTYADIERGKKDVTIRRLEQVAEKLGVSLNDIMMFSERIANFFDNCTNTSVSAGEVKGYNGNQNNYDNRELQHQIEKQVIELKLLKSEKEKAELEAKYWKGLAEK
jgi:transcriptional regulator with XRE-family HTH domain